VVIYGQESLPRVESRAISGSAHSASLADLVMPVLFSFSFFTISEGCSKAKVIGAGDNLFERSSSWLRPLASHCEKVSVA
jgi:hypothetical protein